MMWKPTLAATLPADVELNTLPYPLLASPKIDGVRATVQGGLLISRNGRPIPCVQAQHLFGRLEYEGLDGELTVGGTYGEGVFNRTTRVVMKRDAHAAGVQFNVFDWNSLKFGRLPFRRRYEALCDKFHSRGDAIVVVQQTPVERTLELSRYETKCLKAGYEGIMLRSITAGPYMQKRSTLKEFYLVKLKRFDYGEAKIVAIRRLEHNLNEERTSTGRRSSVRSGIEVDTERWGSAVLEDLESKVQFSVSIAGDVPQLWSGWSDAAKWAGKHIRYKFQPVGSMNGVPRFPTATFEELLG